MKKQILIGISLLILFSTIKLKQDYKITKFNIIEINMKQFINKEYRITKFLSLSIINLIFKK